MQTLNEDPSPETSRQVRNDGPNHIHGGVKGYDKRVWNAELVDDPNDCVLGLSLFSADGEEGYPGNVKINVEYRLNNDNELRISSSAETDKATPITLTNHTYFNLNAFKDNRLPAELGLRQFMGANRKS